ncbi:MAG: YCF48-related protein [Candidatus Acidiferrales bacterium]
MKRPSVQIAILLCLAGTALAQQAKPKTTPSKSGASEKSAQPKFKAIWEPVNYKEDLNFADVYFVSEQEGWVTGEHGTILYTKNGGDTWTAQLGGDPQSTDSKINALRFVNATHGWANMTSGSRLLRTTDGQSWEEIGKLGDYYGGWGDYVFISEKVGIQIRRAGTGPGDIAQTRDAGKTWTSVLPGCAAKMEIQGLTREVGCTLMSLSFPTPMVGYAAGTAARALFVEKTTDGGQTWKVFVTPDVASENSTYFSQQVTFSTENTGFVAMDDGKILATTDGGQNWHGAVGYINRKIKFADAEVGWSFNGNKLTYTVNGGKSWSSRDLRFPTDVVAFSLPTRQRGYVVGSHGMIYRYRIVPYDYAGKNIVEAPMMPAAAGAQSQ